MATSPVVFRFIGDTTGFRSAVGNLQGYIQRIAPSGSSGLFGPIAAAATFAGAQIIQTLGQVGAALAQLGIQGVTDYAELEAATARITNVFGEQLDSMGGFDAVNAQVYGEALRLASEYGLETNDVTDAIYGAVSATGDLEKAFLITELGAKQARVENAELATSTEVLTTATNAFQLSAEEIPGAADSLAAAVDQGSISTDKFQKTLGNAASTANNLGLDVGELAALYAHVTGEGQKLEKGTNGLNSAFIEMLDPTSSVSEFFQDMTGHTIPDFLDTEGDIADVLQLIDSGAREAGIGMTELFDTREAGVTFLDLTGSKLDKFLGRLDSVEDGAGKLNTAFANIEDSPQLALDRLNASLHEFSVTIGEALSPFLVLITPLIQEFVSGLGDDASTLFSDLGAALADVVPSMLELAKAWLDMWPAVRPLIGPMTTLVIVFANMLQPVNLLKSFLGLLAGVLALPVAGAVALSVGLGKLVGWILSLIDIDISGWPGAVVHALSVVGNWFKNLPGNIVTWVGDVATKVWEAGTKVAGWFVDKLAGIADWFKALPGKLWDWISGTVSKIWDTAKSLASNLTDKLTGIGDWFKGLPGKLWGWVSAAIGSIWAVGTSLASNITDKLVGIGNWFTSLPGKLWGWISGTVSKIWDVGKNIATAVFENLGGIGIWFKELPGKIWGWISENISKLWDVGTDLAGEITGKFVDAFKSAINSIIGIWNRIDFEIGPFSIPSWVPFAGGKSFHIKDVFPDIAPLPMAKGGIVTRPTFAMIGEAGPEAVIPLGRRGTPTAINVTVNVDGFVGSEQRLGEKIVNALSRWERVNGPLNPGRLARQ